MNDELRQRLIALKDKDLETRSRLLNARVLFDGYHPDMEAVHCDNARQLEQILDEHGWPGISLVGEAAAWPVAQHAISAPSTQTKALVYLTDAVSRGDAPAWHRAFLQDRILANQEKPQLYGAIWDWNEHGELSTWVDDPQKANERRQAIGLPSLEESMQEYRAHVAAEGAKGASNYAEYKQKRRAWAVRVGWMSET